MRQAIKTLTKFKPRGRIKQGAVMDTIDVRGLPEEIAQQIQELINLLKEEKTQKVSPVKEGKIEFGSFPLGVKGKVTREEIYDYL